MSLKSLRGVMGATFAVCAVILFSAPASAQSVSGAILIKKKLTKPSVTASVSVYQRGPTVKLGNDTGDDPLALERARVVVYLEGPSLAKGGAAVGVTAEVKQFDRRFIPELVVVQAGSTVSFPNMDPIFHNIYSLSKPKTFDLGSYDKGQTRMVSFMKPGIVEVYCHLHPNMAAIVAVTPNRYYARADAGGHYRIGDVPPGQYTVVAWHKSAGYFRKNVAVGAGENVTVDFFIPLDVDQATTGSGSNAATSAGSR